MSADDREQAALSAILRREGWPLFTDRAADKGGPTKGGITLKTLQRHRPGATVEDLKALTLPQAAAIYFNDYLAPFAAVADDALWESLVDFGVTSGPAVAIKAAQQAVGVETDGILGPVTSGAINAADPIVVREQVVILRLKAIGRILSFSAKQHRSVAPDCQGANAAGWIDRCVAFLPHYDAAKVG